MDTVSSVNVLVSAAYAAIGNFVCDAFLFDAHVASTAVIVLAAGFAALAFFVPALSSDAVTCFAVIVVVNVTGLASLSKVVTADFVLADLRITVAMKVTWRYRRNGT